MEDKHIIIGTAGHIDHGKTALISALTGIDTDRLPEEKKRGISIDLGFAYLDLPSGLRAGIVDVPGHERFIKNMLAGASGIDLALLVIAADEGFMPQTREHLDILELLRIRSGLVALSKIDIVDEEWLEYIKEDIRNELKASRLENAPIVETSAVTGQGISELLMKLDEVALKLKPRDNKGFFRLPIDRVFTVLGFGTVLTGTLISGLVKIGDIVEILPKGKKARVRGIQTHNKDVEEAFEGQRTAINLAGIAKEEVTRGDVLATPDYLEPTYMFTARLELLPSAPKPLVNRARVRVHLGTSEIMGRISLIDKEELKPGDSALVQFRLEAELVTQRGDRYVIRSYSPMRTIGGGTVLESNPPKHKRFKQEIIKGLLVKESGSPQQLLEQILRETRRYPLTEKELIKRSGLTKGEVADALDKLMVKGKIKALDKDTSRLFILNETYEDIAGKIIDIMTQFHTINPLKVGISQSELANKVALDLRIFGRILSQMEEEGKIKEEGNLVRLSEHKIRLSPAQDLQVKEIEGRFLTDKFSPPSIEDIKDELNFGEEEIEEIVQLLSERKILVKVSSEVSFHREAIEEAKDLLLKEISSKGEISLGEFRDILKTSRKYALPLLEYFDELSLTRRVGNKRTLR